MTTPKNLEHRQWHDETVVGICPVCDVSLHITIGGARPKFMPCRLLTCPFENKRSRNAAEKRLALKRSGAGTAAAMLADELG